MSKLCMNSHLSSQTFSFNPCIGMMRIRAPDAERVAKTAAWPNIASGMNDIIDVHLRDSNVYRAHQSTACHTLHRCSNRHESPYPWRRLVLFHQCPLQVLCLESSNCILKSR